MTTAPQLHTNSIFLALAGVIGRPDREATFDVVDGRLVPSEVGDLYTPLHDESLKAFWQRLMETCAAHVGDQVEACIADGTLRYVIVRHRDYGRPLTQLCEEKCVKAWKLTLAVLATGNGRLIFTVAGNGLRIADLDVTIRKLDKESLSDFVARVGAIGEGCSCRTISFKSTGRGRIGSARVMRKEVYN